jgi:hypothetical protein
MPEKCGPLDICPATDRKTIRKMTAAGGHMVRNEHAPSWWTLADAAGNEASISTTMNRD